MTGLVVGFGVWLAAGTRDAPPAARSAARDHRGSIVPAAARDHGGTTVQPAARDHRGTTVQPAVRRYTLSGVWGRGSWSWFADPRGVYVGNPYHEVVVGWIDWSGAVTVGEFDPVLGVLRKAIVGYLFHDDHGSPALLVEPDKRITVFFSAHDGHTMSERSTLRPADITAWGPVRHVPLGLPGTLGFTYPNPVMLAGEGEKLYLFWRGADWSADFATRAADARWTKARELIRVEGQRPYVKVDGDGRNSIALAFTNGHPRNVLTSVYYAEYRRGSLWHADGRWIARVGGRAIAPRSADVVYDARTTGVAAWVWDVALDRRDRPVIVYATFPSAQRHEYWYADRVGGRWVSHFLTIGGGTISPGTIEYEYSGGITLDHSNPAVVYLSREVSRGFQIERWTTSDGGYHWRRAVVVRANGTENVRPFVVRGWPHGPMSLLWLSGRYGSYTGYRTSVAYLR